MPLEGSAAGWVPPVAEAGLEEDRGFAALPLVARVRVLPACRSASAQNSDRRFRISNVVQCWADPADPLLEPSVLPHSFGCWPRAFPKTDPWAQA